jgi:hypothetical protein
MGITIVFQSMGLSLFPQETVSDIVTKKIMYS